LTGFGLAPLLMARSALCVPVPESDTWSGLLGASLGMSSLAVRDPMALGANLTSTEQVPLGATVAPEHVSVPTGKSPGFVPDVATVPRWRSSVPVLVTVTVFGELVVPTGWLPKLRLDALRLTAGAIPVPESDT